MGQTRLRTGGWKEALLAAGLAAATGVPIACGPSPPPSNARSAGARTARMARLPRFEARLEFSLGRPKPRGVLAGDFDQDGQPELAVTTFDPGTLEIWHADPRTGIWGAGRRFQTGGYPVGPVRVPDLESGITPWIAVASQETLTLTILDWTAATGNERLGGCQLPATPRALTAGILGRDAVRIAVVCESGRVVLVDPHGQGREVLSILPAEDLPTCARLMAAGSGLLVGLQDARELVLLPHDGSASLGPISERAELGGIPRDLVELDLDGDGDLEIVVGGGDDDLWVFGWGGEQAAAAGGSGLLGQALRWEAGSVPLDLEVADVDLDGRQELLVVAHDEQSFAVLDDFTASGPRSRIDQEAGPTPMCIAAAPLDGDASVDVAVANRDGHCLTLVRGGGGSFRVVHTIPAFRAPRSVCAGDFDGDGLPEGAVLSAIRGRVDLLDNPAGRPELGRLVVEGGAVDLLRSADLDGDERLDLCFLAQRGAAFALETWFGTESGELARRPEVRPPPTVQAVGDLVLHDLDGRSTPELILADPVSATVTVHAREPGGPDEYATRLVLEHRVPGEPAALAVLPGGDDVPLRLAVGLQGPIDRTGVLVLETDLAKGCERTAFLPTLGPVGAVRSLDMDGDSRDDLIVLERPRGDVAPGRVLLWLQLSDATWRETPPLATGLAPRDLECGDLDGNGLADVVVNARHSHQLNVWLGIPGDPYRLRRAPDLGVGRGPLDLCLADFDSDGWPDILVAQHFASSVGVVFNRGPREHAPAPAPQASPIR